MTSISTKFLLVSIAIAWLSAGPLVQRDMTVAGLFRFLREADVQGMSDEETAAGLRRFHLAEHLSPAGVEAAEKLGAGPQTFEILRVLGAGSASAKQISLPFTQPPPSGTELDGIVAKAISYASAYTQALPNFLCVQTTAFYKRGKPGKGGPNWRVDQTVVEDVRFHDGTEDYSTKLIDNKPSTAPVAEARSVYTRGEFGGVLAGVLDLSSHAKYAWSHWEDLDGRRLAVVSYQIERTHSSYRVCCVELGSVTVNGVRHQQRRSEIIGYRGYLYIDPETGVIHILTMVNAEIPPGLMLDEAKNLIEYQSITIDRKSAWLPSRAVHYSRQGAFASRSEISFSGYRAFGAHATIEFPTEPAPPQ